MKKAIIKKETSEDDELQNKEGECMTKKIQKKVSATIWGTILLTYIILAIVKREIFSVETHNITMVNGEFELVGAQEVDGRLVFIFLVFLVMFSYFFISSLLWKLEYNDENFSMEHEGIHELQYKKITSIIHYTAHRYRGSTNEFIINYLGTSEFETQEKTQKAIIKKYPFGRRMKEFFSFVRKQNPAIDFHSENAGYDGIERNEFDYFADSTGKETFGDVE